MNNEVGDYQYVPFPEPGPEGRTRAMAMVRSDIDVAAAVQAANDALADAGSHWQLGIETGGTFPYVVPLILAHPDVLGRRQIPAVGAMLTNLLGLDSALDPMLVGTVAYKPGGMTRGDFGRVPVAMPAAAPMAAAPATDQPRTIAVLDTAVYPHEALDGGFCVDARSLGWTPGPRLPAPEDPPDEFNGELPDQWGHGTFTAGLIHRLAPAARILAVHAIADDGTAYGDHVLNALAWLADGQLRAGDVVCLPLGFRPRLPGDRVYLDWLAERLGVLANGDVTVVAAAGNDGNSDPIYPAAFAGSAPTPPKNWIRSVGAVNVENDKTPAYYSNTGAWVTHHEVGTSLVSTFPRVNAAAAPELTVGGRSSADPDDFRGGFARWSGTSFAAAIHAAKIADGKA